MDKYNVLLLQPPGEEPSFEFLEVARLLTHSLRSLGKTCDLRVNEATGGEVNILLGYHLLRPGFTPAADLDYVVYQLQPLSNGGEKLVEQHGELLRRARAVWDYAPENVAVLERHGLTKVGLLPIGYHAALRKIQPRAEEIDILCEGSSGRCDSVLNELGRSHRVEKLAGVYGDSRDAYIARSKIVLSVASHEGDPLDQVRISYLLNNGRLVIGERLAANPYENAVVSGSFRELAELCRRYLGDATERTRVAQRGFALFRQRAMVEHLKNVL